METKQKQAKSNDKTIGYGFQKQLDLPFHEAVERTRAALADEGFGVLCEIDIKEKLRDKLGIDCRNYVILGACNPSLAYQTLQEDINVGLLLPCNVVVYEADDKDKSVVAAIDAKAMLSVIGENPEIEETAQQVNERLQRAIERV